MDFTTEIGRTFKFFLSILLPTVFMFLLFLTLSAGLAVTLLLFTTSNRLSTVICFVSTDKSSKKRKIHGAGKTEKRQYWPISVLSHNALYPEKLSEVNGVALIYAQLIESRLWVLELGKVDHKCEGQPEEKLAGLFHPFGNLIPS